MNKSKLNIEAIPHYVIWLFILALTVNAANLDDLALQQCRSYSICHQVAKTSHMQAGNRESDISVQSTDTGRQSDYDYDQDDCCIIPDYENQSSSFLEIHQTNTNYKEIRISRCSYLEFCTLLI